MESRQTVILLVKYQKEYIYILYLYIFGVYLYIIFIYFWSIFIYSIYIFLYCYNTLETYVIIVNVYAVLYFYKDN